MLNLRFCNELSTSIPTPTEIYLVHMNRYCQSVQMEKTIRKVRYDEQPGVEAMFCSVNEKWAKL